MIAHRFSYGPAVLAGPGSRRCLGELALPPRVLFVTDAQIVALGLAQTSIDALEKAGSRVVLFDAVEADPSTQTLEAAIELGRREDVQAVIGFGGGSPMDVAKLAAYLLGSGERLEDIWGVGRAMGRRLALILIPTTAGTGSEATPVAIITDSNGVKRGVSAPALVADHALLDAELTTGLPAFVTSTTGIDAIVHAVEAFTSQHLKNPISDLLAREALTLLGSNLLLALASPECIVSRQAMLLGSHLAGVAFANAPVAGVHALAYPLGGRFHVSHGLSNALMLPHVLRFNLPVAEAAYSELCATIDPSLTNASAPIAAQKFIRWVENLVAQTGLPRRLRDVGIVVDDVPTLSSDAMLQERLLRNNPRPIHFDDAFRLYEEAL